MRIQRMTEAGRYCEAGLPRARSRMDACTLVATWKDAQGMALCDIHAAPAAEGKPVPKARMTYRALAAEEDGSVGR